jgi:outer membrane lipoprotein carrier protein
MAAVLLSAGPPVRQSVDPWPILDRADAAYQTVRSFSADFVQVIANPLIGEPDTTLGKLYQMRPNYFEMRFTSPKGDRIVADGRHLWLYTPSTTPGQVIRASIPTVGTTGPNLIGQFVDHAHERYEARYIRRDTLPGLPGPPGPEGATDVIALEPKDPNVPYRSAVLWIGRDDALVRRMDISELSGQVRTVILHRLEVNGNIPGREFRFSVPRGVQVVDQ